MTLTQPEDLRLLDNLEDRLRAQDPAHPFLAALRRLRADHTALARQNVELLSAELERLERPAGLREVEAA